MTSHPKMGEPKNNSIIIDGDSGPKTRGRPTKDSSGNAAIDLQRARGRRAQEALRLRREQHVRALEGKVSVLEETVEQMSQAFINFSDGLLNSGRAAGDPDLTRDLKMTMELFLQLSQKIPRDLEKDDDATKADYATQGVVEKSVNPFDLSKVLSRPSQSSSLVLAMSQTSWYPAAVTNPVQNMPNSNAPDRVTASPFLASTWPKSSNSHPINPSPLPDHKLWGSPPVSGNSSDIVPYIVAGRDSFASRLYFDTVVLAFRSLRGDDGFSSEVANNMFGYKLRYLQPYKILSIIGGVLDEMLHGTSQIPIGGLNAGPFLLPQQPSSSRPAIDLRAMKAEIVKEVIASGGSESDYLNAWGVQRYLRDEWELAIDSNSVRRLPAVVFEPMERMFSSPFDQQVTAAQPYKDPRVHAPTVIPGFRHGPEAILNVQSLLDEIILRTVTIGDGPRWAKTDIDAAVLSFLKENEVVF